jgi:hypothetical protein
MKKLTTATQSLDSFIVHQFIETDKIKGGEDSIIIEDIRVG